MFEKAHPIHSFSAGRKYTDESSCMPKTSFGHSPKTVKAFEFPITSALKVRVLAQSTAQLQKKRSFCSLLRPTLCALYFSASLPRAVKRRVDMSFDGGVEPNPRAGQQAIDAPLASSKQPTSMSNPVETHSVARRLQSELMALMTCGDPGVSAFPEGDNIFSWVGTIKGSAGTVYDGLSYKLSLRFPPEYPFKSPIVKFDTPCFHPNVDQYGNICLDILQDKWSSAYDVRTILLSIQSLLGEPNNDSPLNSYAAALWVNQEEYRKVMLKQVKDGGLNAR